MLITAKANKFSILRAINKSEDFELILRNEGFDKLRGRDQICIANLAFARDFAVFRQANRTLEISSLHSLVTHAKTRLCLSIERKPYLNEFSSRMSFNPFRRVAVFGHNIFKISFIHDCFVKPSSFFCYNLGKNVRNWCKIPKKHG